MSGEAHHIMLLRHPQTEANRLRRYIGREDSPVTEIGLAQTRHLAAVVNEWEPDEVLTSPLGRTISTARAIAPAGVPVSILEDLAEIDFGDIEGLTWAEIEASGMRLDYATGGPIAPGGEMLGAFHDRVRRAAAVIEVGSMRSVVVTHGGVMRRLLAEWLGIPFGLLWRIAVPNAVVARLCVTDGIGVLESLVPPPAQDPA